MLSFTRKSIWQSCTRMTARYTVVGKTVMVVLLTIFLTISEECQSTPWSGAYQGRLSPLQDLLAKDSCSPWKWQHHVRSRLSDCLLQKRCPDNLPRKTGSPNGSFKMAHHRNILLRWHSAGRQSSPIWGFSEVSKTLDDPFKCWAFCYFRSFSNFILIITSPRIKSARQLVHQFSRQADLCVKTKNVLVVSTDNLDIVRTLELPRRPPMLLHIAHGLYIIFDGNLQVINISFANCIDFCNQLKSTTQT